MMPLGIPKVPYRMPGSQQADWVDIYNRMYRERIIFLGETIDDQIVNQIIAVMLFADSEATQQVESAALLARQLAAPGRLGPPGLGRMGPPDLTDRGRPMHPGGTTQPFRPQWQPATLRRRRPCPSHAAACPLPHSRPLATPRDVKDEKKPQYLYINSPGGSVTAGLALYDTMGHVNSDVITVNAGAAG